MGKMAGGHPPLQRLPLDAIKHINHEFVKEFAVEMFNKCEKDLYRR